MRCMHELSTPSLFLTMHLFTTCTRSVLYCIEYQARVGIARPVKTLINNCFYVARILLLLIARHRLSVVELPRPDYCILNHKNHEMSIIRLEIIKTTTHKKCIVYYDYLVWIWCIWCMFWKNIHFNQYQM